MKTAVRKQINDLDVADYFAYLAELARPRVIVAQFGETPSIGLVAYQLNGLQHLIAAPASPP